MSAPFSWEGLDLIEKAIDALAERARKIREQRPAKGRELATVLIQQVGPFDALDYRLKEVTFYNGDERDLVIEQLSCRVTLLTATSATEMFRVGGTGFAQAFTAGAGAGWMTGLNSGIFDFGWNMRKDQTQASYSRNYLLSSFSLGDLPRKRYLEFKRPLVLKTSEGAVFGVQPTCWRNPTANRQVMVTFVGFGYRRQPQ